MPLLEPADEQKLTRDVDSHSQMTSAEYVALLKTEYLRELHTLFDNVSIAPDTSERELTQIIKSRIFPMYSVIRDLVFKSTVYDQQYSGTTNFFGHMLKFGDALAPVENVSLLHSLQLGNDKNPLYLFVLYLPERSANNYLFGMTSSTTWVKGVTKAQNTVNENYARLGELQYVKKSLIEMDENEAMHIDTYTMPDAKPMYTKGDLPEVEKEIARLIEIVAMHIYIIDGKTLVVAKNQADATAFLREHNAWHQVIF